MASVTQASTASANGRAGGPSGPVAERVAELRELARTDPEAARDQSWEWIEELGRRAPRDREGALAELQQMFEAGRPAEGIRGQTEGLLVTWTMTPGLDKAVGAVTNLWMPWVGKKFEPGEKRGINTLTGGARWASKLLWPLYKMTPDELGASAFAFTTYVEAGVLDPGVDVLVIDYESVRANPNLIIRQIRDELVEVVPGANLGKMLVYLPRRHQPYHALYFALKSEL